MAYGNYITPSQTSIYLGALHVDDAYSIDWQYRNSRTPMYNYFQEEVANAALGKKLVTGTISINFRYPGYLEYAVEKARNGVSSSEGAKRYIAGLTQNGKAATDTYLNEMRDGTASSRMTLLLQAAIAGPASLARMSALAQMAQTTYQNSNQRFTEFQDMFDVQNPHLDVVPVDIWTHFGDIDEVHVAQRIEDVVFVGESQQVQAGASPSGGLSASGINILEVYSFWAKKVTKITVDPSR